jgi:2-hydroxyethylphosphonate dioxygenase
VADKLDVPWSDIAAAAASTLPSVIHRDADSFLASCRPLSRDGIHFYNYFSIASPPDRIGPVILDILCPRDRLPMLNSGHLEPAITVNLGPGDIMGRWSEDLDDRTWKRLRAATDDPRWIVGESYMESPFCPHSYALASDTPARIVSYTAQSRLQPIIEMNDQWTDAEFDRFIDSLRTDAYELEMALRAKGYQPDGAGLSSSSRATVGQLRADPALVTLEEVRSLANELRIDYRSLLPSSRDLDELGRTWCSLEESRTSIRPFGSYWIASMASSVALPDIVGLFLLVEPGSPGELDLIASTELHYFVADGHAVLTWEDANGASKVELGPDSSLWVAPFVPHAFEGSAALLRFDSGVGLASAERLEVERTFRAQTTLRRGRHDLVGWSPEGAGGR